MEQQERDLLLLQQRVERNKEWTDYHIAELRGLVSDHTRQLLVLQQRPASDQLPIFGSSLKLVIAILFPMLVLALTGDLKQALAALKLVTTPG